MSYETVVEQVRTLPEDCLEDLSKYMQFLLYQYSLNKMNNLTETDEEFNAKMQNGYDDMLAGRVKPLNKAFTDIRRRFS
ncbi:MAG: hypothetical protein IKQ61_11695 [Spirochaetales bacterium]|nr:hypothetical protein [Spirochaetales bacterium]